MTIEVQISETAESKSTLHSNIFFFAIVFFWQNTVPLVIHYSPSMFIFLFKKKKFLMLIIRPQIFKCKHIPRSHTDTLWHQTNCQSISEKLVERRGSAASHWFGNSADAHVTDSRSSLVGFPSSEVLGTVAPKVLFWIPRSSREVSAVVGPQHISASVREAHSQGLWLSIASWALQRVVSLW